MDWRDGAFWRVYFAGDEDETESDDEDDVVDNRHLPDVVRVATSLRTAEGRGMAGAPSPRTRRRDGTTAEDVASTDLAAADGHGVRHFEQTTTQRRRGDMAGEAPFRTKAEATEGGVSGIRRQRGGGGDG